MKFGYLNSYKPGGPTCHPTLSLSPLCRMCAAPALLLSPPARHAWVTAESHTRSSFHCWAPNPPLFPLSPPPSGDSASPLKAALALPLSFSHMNSSPVRSFLFFLHCCLSSSEYRSLPPSLGFDRNATIFPFFSESCHCLVFLQIELAHTLPSLAQT
jgi:hypothetical protein